MPAPRSRRCRTTRWISSAPPDGRVVGGWSQRRDGEIVFELLEDVGAEAVAAVEAEAERAADWLGEVRFSPGFLPPFQRGLAER